MAFLLFEKAALIKMTSVKMLLDTDCIYFDEHDAKWNIRVSTCIIDITCEDKKAGLFIDAETNYTKRTYSSSHVQVTEAIFKTGADVSLVVSKRNYLNPEEDRAYVQLDTGTTLMWHDIPLRVAEIVIGIAEDAPEIDLIILGARNIVRLKRG